MSQADLIIYGTLLAVALIAALLIWWGINSRKKQDALSRSLTADDIRELTRDERVGECFLWCIWQDRLSRTAFKLHVRDETGAELTVATRLFIPRHGVTVTYVVDGHPRECGWESLGSNRTLLKNADNGETLLACEHTLARERILDSDLTTERCQIQRLSLRKETRAVTMAGREIGQLFMVKKLHFHVLVLSVLPQTLTREEQLFILAGIGAGR